jgi:hypothetical protein
MMGVHLDMNAVLDDQAHRAERQLWPILRFSFGITVAAALLFVVVRSLLGPPPEAARHGKGISEINNLKTAFSDRKFDSCGRAWRDQGVEGLCHADT